MLPVSTFSLVKKKLLTGYKGRTMDKSKIHHSHKDHWRTPDTLWEAICKRFGTPEYDMAASVGNARCDNYFTAEDDSLSLNWADYGVKWCNPPFSLKREFIAKADCGSGYGTIMVLPVDTSTEWFHDLCGRAKVYLLKGRVQFYLTEEEILAMPEEERPKKINSNQGGTCVALFGAEPGIELWDWKN